MGLVAHILNVNYFVRRDNSALAIALLELQSKPAVEYPNHLQQMKGKIAAANDLSAKPKKERYL